MCALWDHVSEGVVMGRSGNPERDAAHVTADHLEHDDEYYVTFLGLIHSSAESARLEASDLLAAGFEVVQVRGLPSVLWKGAGALDGALYTEHAALAEIRPTIEDPRDEEDRG